MQGGVKPAAGPHALWQDQEVNLPGITGLSFWVVTAAYPDEYSFSWKIRNLVTLGSLFHVATMSCNFFKGLFYSHL